MPSTALPRNSRRTKKRSRAKSCRNDVGPSESNKRRKSATGILSGMLIAVSTLQTAKTEETEETTSSSSPCDVSYRTVTEACRNAGATVSSQIHKKVKCVLCTKSAIAQATQRVRKAQKKGIPLVDVAWLYECLKMKEKLPFDSYLLDYPTAITHHEEDQETHKKSRDKQKSEDSENNENQDVDEKDIPDSGWSSPVDVGCCCVCHENGDTNCSWCTDCKS